MSPGSDNPFWLSLDRAQAGIEVECDGSFPCIEKGARRIIEVDDNGELFISCSEGRHMLPGQEDELDGELGFVGLCEVADASAKKS